jgi:hypothetical protein
VRITEDKFQNAVKYGGIALGIAAILNLYFVLKYREVYRDRVRAEQQFQQMLMQQQELEGVLQEFAQRAPKDPQVAEILRKYQIIGSAPAAAGNQASGARP